MPNLVVILCLLLWVHKNSSTKLYIYDKYFEFHLNRSHFILDDGCFEGSLTLNEHSLSMYIEMSSIKINHLPTKLLEKQNVNLTILTQGKQKVLYTIVPQFQKYLRSRLEVRITNYHRNTIVLVKSSKMVEQKV